MSADSNIRRLRPEDAAALASLRREALTSDPLAFSASTEDDRALSLDFVRSALADDQEQAVFGKFEGADLTGMVGVIRASGVKQRHKGTIWGMYVVPRARNNGVGRALLEAAIDHARSWSGLEQLELGVTDAALTARRLYETAGFRRWGREPRALQWNGRFVAEHHLVLHLREG